MQYFFNWIGGSRRTGDQLISMNPNLSRIVIYKKTLELMEKKARQDLKFVRLGVTDKRPKAFWIMPCAEGDEGALKVHITGNTRMISAKSLFNKLEEKGWYNPKEKNNPKEKTDQFPADWDEENKGIKVDLAEKPSPKV